MASAGRPEFCAVCGDPAIGFHYEVPSCSGCRSFFRRTIKEQKSYTCRKEGKCMADRANLERISCKKCRLESCVEAGMNPQALQSADINVPTNALAQIIVARQRINRTMAAAALVVGPSTSLNTVEDRVQKLSDLLVLTKRAHDKLRCSLFSPTPADQYNLDRFFASVSKIGSDVECMLQGANRQLLVARAPPFAVLQGRLKWWHLADCIYSLEYMRTFPWFDQLSERDKRSLAIHLVSEVSNFTRCFFSAEQKSEVTVNPDGIRHNSLEDWKSVAEYEYDCEIIMSLYRLSIDEMEFALLKAIVSTGSAIVGLSDDGRALLEMYQTTYRKALISLAIARRGTVEGPKWYSQCLLMLSTLTKLTMLKKAEGKHLYAPYKGTPFECPIIEEILYEDPYLAHIN